MTILYPQITHSLSGNTAGVLTQISSGSYYLVGGDNITLSQDGNTVTVIGASGGAGGAGSNTFGMSNLGNTSGTTGVVSGSAVRYLFAGGNNVTLSQSINGVSGTVTISAFNQTVESQSAGISNVGNTSGTTGIASGGQVQLILAGGNNVTLSQSLNGASATVTVSAFNQTVESQSLGMSNLGNTSGTTGIASGGQVQYLLAGGNNITLSQSLNGASGTLTIIGGAGGGGGPAISANGNSVSNGTVVFSNSNKVSFGMNGSTVTASVASTMSTLEPHCEAEQIGPPTAGALSFQPVHVPAYMTAATMNMLFSWSSVTGSTAAFSISGAIYSLNGSSLSLASSGSYGISWTNSSANWSNKTGVRIWSLPVTFNVTPGPWYLGAWASMVNVTNRVTILGAQSYSHNAYQAGDVTNSVQIIPGLGYYSATTNAMPANVPVTQLVGTDVLRPYIALNATL